MWGNKIIIICPSMWPDMHTWGETQRMFYLANYLSNQEWDVTVISPRYKTDKPIEEIKKQQYRNLYIGNSIKKHKIKTPNKITLKPGVLLHIKWRIAALLNNCCELLYGESGIQKIYNNIIWIEKNKNEICQAIKERDVDKVIISMPTFVYARLGKIIKKECKNVKVIYDYRDPWYLWKQKKNIGYLRERHCLKYADCIVGCSEKFRNSMIDKLGVTKNKIYTVYNGYSEKAWEKFEKIYNSKTQIKEKPKKMIMTYTGNISLNVRKANYRNPQYLINAVKCLPNVELYLVGVTGFTGKISDGNVHYIGEVTQQQSFAYMMNSDVLISIHDTADKSGDYIISGKFYDYMRSRKYILHIGQSKSLMAKFINDMHLGSICENVDDELREKILELLQLWNEDKLVLKDSNMQYIKRFSREHQNKKYMQIISEV